MYVLETMGKGSFGILYTGWHVFDGDRKKNGTEKLKFSIRRGNHTLYLNVQQFKPQNFEESPVPNRR